MDEVILNLGIIEWTTRQVIALGLVLALSFLLYRIFTKILMPAILNGLQFEKQARIRIYRQSFFLLILLTLLGVMWALKIDWDLLYFTKYPFRLSLLLSGVFLILLARMMDRIISRWFTRSYESQQKADRKKNIELIKKSGPNQTIQWAVYLLVAIFVLKNFRWDAELMTFQNGKVGLNISDLLFAILIFVFARLSAWVLTRVIMMPYYRNNSIDVGTQYAVNQLVTYVIFVLAFFFSIESLGMSFTVLWGSAAALLVGVGLGLQQTFNDLTSGIILLFDRSIEVGNVVDLKGTVGIVRKIGLRTSQVETRDNIIIIVPNSKLIVDEVVNWSHFDDKARFKVTVGVAYGSDTELVKELMLSVARDNVFVLEHPSPSVFFAGFGDSSLDFELYFWSRNFMFIERVKSDIRFEIDRKFRENNVTIPFPQRDLWIKGELPSFKSDTHNPSA